MEITEIIGYSGAMAAGLALGLLGSGGSVIAIPIFTYFFHISPVTTTAYSLFVVGTSASVGVLGNWKKNLVDFKPTLVFAVPIFIAIYLVRRYLLPKIPDVLFTGQDLILTKEMGIMSLLAILMFVSALLMLRNRKESVVKNGSKRRHYTKMVFLGLAIGALTGLVGMGGGFLIIPTLVLLAKLPMKKAVATSMFIIALKSLIGFMGDLSHLKVDWSFLAGFTLLSILGTFLGIYLSTYVDGNRLKKSFGWIVLCIALGVFYLEFL